MKTNGNDLAFGTPIEFVDGWPHAQPTLTKREYFASNPPAAAIPESITIGESEKIFGKRDYSRAELIAHYAVEYADALIEALNKEEV